MPLPMPLKHVGGFTMLRPAQLEKRGLTQRPAARNKYTTHLSSAFAGSSS